MVKLKADELRGGVEKKQQSAEETRKKQKADPKAPPSNTNNKNPDGNTPPVSQPDVQRFEEERRVPEKNNEQKYDEMTEDEREEHELIHLTDPTEKKDDKKKKLNIGNIKDNFDDPDYGEPEKGKFEIKEGDIIDYLFKEVFLASCNWVGDTAGGYIGLAAYRTGSWIYHNPGKWTAETINNGRKELIKNIKNIFTSSKVSENEINNIPNNETGRFTNSVLSLHSKQLKINPIIAHAENIEKIVKAIGQGKADSIAALPDSFKQMIKKIPPEILSQAANDPERVTAIMTEKATEYMALNTFASNYATATLLDAKAKDKNFNPENTEALFEMQLLEGKKLFLTNLAKPEQERIDHVELGKMAQEARTQASKNIIKDGKYDEVDKAPAPNPELIKLQQMLGKIPANTRAEGMDDTAEEQQQIDSKNKKKINAANQDVEASQSEKDEHKSKRKPKGTRLVSAEKPKTNPKKQGGRE